MIWYGDVSDLYVKELIKLGVNIKELRNCMQIGLKRKLEIYEYAVKSGAENNIIDWKKGKEEIEGCLEALEKNNPFEYKGIKIEAYT